MQGLLRVTLTMLRYMSEAGFSPVMKMKTSSADYVTHSVRSSIQFPLCNRYVGEWRDGLREGQGTFYYARSE